jgi:hypothetical protein
MNYGLQLCKQCEHAFYCIDKESRLQRHVNFVAKESVLLFWPRHVNRMFCGIGVCERQLFKSMATLSFQEAANK